MTRTAIYPGTFDPPTYGHMDIIGRAARLADHLVIGVAINRDKGPLFSLEERIAMVEDEVRPFAAKGHARFTVRPFEGLLVRFAKDAGASMIIRGLRTTTDFNYESQMVGMNARMEPEIETVFLMADGRYQAIASTLVREIARMGGDVTPFVSWGIASKIYARVGRAAPGTS